MSKEIHLIKNNDNKDWCDRDWVDEFYKFLQGEVPQGITMDNPPKLSEKQAFSVIWFLQEAFPVIPDHIERCDVCGYIYDSHSGGWSTEHANVKGHHNFCDTDCEATHPFPVRPLVELLKEVRELLPSRNNCDLDDIAIEMYEGNDQINRDERNLLREYFDKDKLWEMSHSDLINWLNNEIIELEPIEVSQK